MLLAPFAKKSTQVKVRMDRIAGMYDTHNAFVVEEFKKPLSQRFILPILHRVVNKVSDFIPKLNNTKLKSMLTMAGFKMEPAVYNSITLLVMVSISVIFLILGILLKVKTVLIIVFLILGMLFGLTLVRYILQVSIRRRKERMRRQMPEVLDLISVSVEAGLGLDTAILHVTKRIEGPLPDELNITLQEINLGMARRDALKALGSRTGLEEMVSFTNAVIQAEQQGITLKNVLNSQAAQIRLNRRQNIQERAMKAPVKIILPLVLLIFPVILIILLAPAVIKIIGVLGGS
jgi:tight adherence protein C